MPASIKVNNFSFFLLGIFFPTSFCLQVLFNERLFGLIPIIIMGFLVCKNTKEIVNWVQNYKLTNNYDYLVILLGSASIFSISYNIYKAQTIDLSAQKFFYLFNTALFIYGYIRIFKKTARKTVKSFFVGTSVVSIFVALFVFFEIIAFGFEPVRHIVEFWRSSFFSYAMNSQETSINPSILLPGNRVNGPLETRQVSAFYLAFLWFFSRQLFKTDGFSNISINKILLVTSYVVIFALLAATSIQMLISVLIVQFLLFFVSSKNLNRDLLIAVILGSSIILFFQIQNYYRYEFIDFLNIKIPDYYTVFGNPFINYTIERFYIFWEIIPNYSLSFFHALFDSLTGSNISFLDYLLGEHSRVSTAFKGGDYGLSETVAYFGILIFSIIIVLFIPMILHGLKYCYSANHQSKSKAIFCYTLAPMLLVGFNEMHYSIWIYEAIIPIPWICGALLVCELERSDNANINTTEH